MWCVQTIDAIFRACMYDVLDLYEEPYDHKKPLVCLDEKPKQLLGEKRMSIPMTPGSPEKYDYEYAGTYRKHIHGRRIQGRKKGDAGH